MRQSPGAPMSKRGAVWNKWDLHIHTPASFQWNGRQFRTMPREQVEQSCREIVEKMNSLDVELFVVMDYWTFDGYLTIRRFLNENEDVKLAKTLLPGMELRCEAPMDERLNIHVILSDELSE